STAIECALKMALQFRRQTGQPAKKMLASFRNGYHGDTLGAARVGGVDGFRDIGSGEGADVVAVGPLEDLKSDARVEVDELAAVILEPLSQGVNEMRPWPTGMLRELRKWCDEKDVPLICEEVMTGYGRTAKKFACQH